MIKHSVALWVVAATFILAPIAVAGPQAIPPQAVAVLYNSSERKSKALAEYYARKRSIPIGNLVGFPLPTTDSMSRVDYNAQLRDPLLKHFENEGWMKRKAVPGGGIQPVENSVRVLVTMRGVPFKISRTPDTIPPEAKKRRHYIPSEHGNEASVDSELSLLGITGYPIKGSINNPYFGQDDSVMAPSHTSFLTVGRIDGPSYPLCQQLIDDAIATEESGLWGMSYLDLSRKGEGYEVGDEWIKTIGALNHRVGIPTVLDANRDTFVTNYPMRDPAVYFGWYTDQRNGPLLNPKFKFRQGAVAVHLHSFSAFELRNPNKRWTGPLLAKGAAATLGNVYEPFLRQTHHLHVFYDRLLKGYTLVEAAAMAIPKFSWQGVVLGDPLYRPFVVRDPLSLSKDSDREYKALRTGFERWGKEPATLVAKLRTAAARMNSGVLYEALGLYYLNGGKPKEAAAFFASAHDKYLPFPDKLRTTLHAIEIERQAGNKQQAVLHLRKLEALFVKLTAETPPEDVPPEGKAITALLSILDPPAPPLVDPDKKKKE